METLAFLLAPVAAALTRDKPSELPTFKPRWWFRYDRLDARPVAWSLINRPKDWEWSRYLHTRVIVHKPSNHEFWVGSGWGFYRLWSADCGCSSNDGLFQPFQQTRFHRAFRRWRRDHDPVVPIDQDHFAGHFVR